MQIILRAPSGFFQEPGDEGDYNNNRLYSSTHKLTWNKQEPTRSMGLDV